MSKKEDSELGRLLRTLVEACTPSKVAESAEHMKCKHGKVKV